MDISPPPSATVTTAATTVKTPDPDSEPPKPQPQLIPPPFTNGVLKRHKPFNHHHQLSTPVVVSYKECLKNHAATMGGHAVDGCGEFMPSPSSSPSIPTSLKCAACGCHRNFHRREDESHHSPSPPPPIQHLLEYQPHHRHQPPPPPEPLAASPLNSPSPPPISSSYYPSSAPHMLLALGSETNNNNHSHSHGHYSSPMSGKKRFRTKFTPAQKEKMHEIASKVGWKMQKRDEDLINGFCNEIGVDRNVFKVWMHNNKSTTNNNKNNNNNNNNNNNDDDDHGHAHASSNNIINVNNINGHDAIDFIMSRNINNNVVSSHNDDVITTNNNNNDNHHDLHLVSGNVIKGSSSSC